VCAVLSTILAAEALLPARWQMAVSLGWHIVIAAFGVAFPAMIFVVHRRGLRGRPEGLVLARRWAKVSGVLFAMGAVSGTILSFELGLLWPGMMGRFGDVVGPTFAVEGLAFFTEAIFLGIYLYGWDRLPPRTHLLTLVPVALAGLVGSFSVLAANAWMNSPAGFDVVDGEVVNIDPFAAMFNDAVLLQWIHMFLAAYMVVGFLVAGTYAVGRRRGRNDAVHRMGFLVPFAFASVATLLQPVVGHFAGERLAHAQPSKFAAIELVPETVDGAPLTIGGVLIDGEVRYGVQIPGLGSLIAAGSPDAQVVGLDDVPEGNEVPASIVHLSFQAMVGIGFSLVGLVAWYWVARRRGRDPFEESDRFRAAVAVAGPAAAFALLAGWVVTEVGRQPWIVYGVMRVDEAVTDAGWIWWSLLTIVVVYASMTVFGTIVLRSMSRRWREGGAELRVPYGPETADEGAIDDGVAEMVDR
jgi:cytochrome bd ubiquinol oxidase subunit I